MNNIVNYRITNGSIVRVMLWAGLAYSLFFFRDLLVTLIVGLVMASTIDPIAKYFKKYKIPRVATVAGVFVLLFLAIISFVYFIIPSLAEDIANLLKSLPKILNDINVFGKNFGISELSIYANELSQNISKGEIITILKNSIIGAGSIFETTGNILGALVNFLMMLVFAFYLAAQEDGINNFLKLITPKYYEKYVLNLWARSEAKIGSWAKGQILVGIIIACLVYVPLKLLGMPYAALFAFLSFIGEMIPMVGLLASSIPAILTAYFTQDLSLALTVALVFFIISQLENYVIYPKVMNKVIGVPAIVILIAFIMGAKVAGFWGIVLAVPLAAIVMEFVNDILNEKLPNQNSVEVIKYD